MGDCSGYAGRSTLSATLGVLIGRYLSLERCWPHIDRDVYGVALPPFGKMAKKGALPSKATESITTKIVKRLSLMEGVDPLELQPPLQTVVDIDAVEDLFSTGAHTQRKGEICVIFAWDGYHVTIDGEEEVDVRVRKRGSN